MKKTKFLAPLALTAAIAAGGFIGGNTYAAGPSFIHLRYPSADGDSRLCYLLKSEGDSSSTLCEDTIGGYDATTKTITLKDAGEAELSISVPSGSTSDAVTIKATANQALISISSGADLIFDLGEHKLTTSGTLITNKDVTVKSGDINVIESGVRNLTINSGKYYSNDKTMSSYDTLTINGGTYSSKTGSININDTIKVTGGEINAKEIVLSSIENTKFEQTGGTVNIVSNELIGISGGGSNKKAEVVISGGKLNINGTDYGINLRGASTISFNGGTSTIANTPTYAIIITGNTDSENAIKFGQNMGIKEDHTYVFWTDDTFEENYRNETGVTSYSNTVTVTSGYGVNKFKGWDIGEIDDYNPNGTEGGSDIKVPDTGANSNEEGGNALAIFAASTFVVLGVFALAIALKIHSAGHFKFDK